MPTASRTSPPPGPGPRDPVKTASGDERRRVAQRVGEDGVSSPHRRARRRLGRAALPTRGRDAEGFALRAHHRVLDLLLALPAVAERTLAHALGARAGMVDAAAPEDPDPGPELYRRAGSAGRRGLKEPGKERAAPAPAPIPAKQPRTCCRRGNGRLCSMKTVPQPHFTLSRGLPARSCGIWMWRRQATHRIVMGLLTRAANSSAAARGLHKEVRHEDETLWQSVTTGGGGPSVAPCPCTGPSGARLGRRPRDRVAPAAPLLPRWTSRGRPHGGPVGGPAAFYAGRDYAPAWLDEDAPRPQARALAEALRDITRRAATPALRGGGGRAGASTRTGVAHHPGRAGPPTGATHSCGWPRSPRRPLQPPRCEPYWAAAAARELDGPALLSEATGTAGPQAALARLRPEHAQYQALLEARDQLRATRSAGGWPLLPALPALRRGSREPRLPLLRERLAASQDLSPGPAPRLPYLFGPRPRAGLKRFQVRHGLPATGGWTRPPSRP